MWLVVSLVSWRPGFKLRLIVVEFNGARSVYVRVIFSEHFGFVLKISFRHYYKRVCIYH